MHECKIPALVQEFALHGHCTGFARGLHGACTELALASGGVRLQRSPSLFSSYKWSLLLIILSANELLYLTFLHLHYLPLTLTFCTLHSMWTEHSSPPVCTMNDRNFAPLGSRNFYLKKGYAPHSHAGRWMIPNQKSMLVCPKKHAYMWKVCLVEKACLYVKRVVDSGGL